MKTIIWLLAVFLIAQETLAEISAEDYLNKCVHLSEYSHAAPKPEPDIEVGRKSVNLQLLR